MFCQKIQNHAIWILNQNKFLFSKNMKKVLLFTKKNSMQLIIKTFIFGFKACNLKYDMKISCENRKFLLAVQKTHSVTLNLSENKHDSLEIYAYHRLICNIILVSKWNNLLFEHIEQVSVDNVPFNTHVLISFSYKSSFKTSAQSILIYPSVV